MRQRSMSVFVPRDDNLSRKFEGVVSDDETLSDFENEDLGTENQVPVEGELSESWSKLEYQTLIAQMRGALPKKDKKKWKTRLRTVDWSLVQVGQRPTTEVERVAEELIAKTRKFLTLSEVLDEVPKVVNKLLVAHRPKHPMTAYNLFVKKKLPKLRRKHKDLKVQQIFQLIPEQYKSLSAKKKSRFEADAARMKEEYHQEMQRFYDEHPELSPKKGYKPKKDPLKTPFHLFFLERQEISKNITPQQARKEWELLPVKDKVPFIQRAFDAQGPTDSKLVNKKELDMLEKNLGKPEFCGRNTYEYYRKQMKETPGKEQEEKFQTDYNKLSNEEKKALKQEYLQARDTFVNEYRKYIKKLPKDKQQAEIDFLKTISEKKSKKVKSENANAPAKDASAPAENANAPAENANAPAEDASAPAENANAPAEDDGYLEEPPAAESTPINKKPPTKTANKTIKRKHKSGHSDTDSLDHATPKKQFSKKAATTPVAAPVASPTKKKQQPSSNNVTSKIDSSDDFEEKKDRAPTKRSKAATKMAKSASESSEELELRISSSEEEEQVPPKRTKAALPASPTKNGKKQPPKKSTARRRY